MKPLLNDRQFELEYLKFISKRAQLICEILACAALGERPLIRRILFLAEIENGGGSPGLERPIPRHLFALQSSFKQKRGFYSRDIDKHMLETLSGNMNRCKREMFVYVLESPAL